MFLPGPAAEFHVRINQDDKVVLDKTLFCEECASPITDAMNLIVTPEFPGGICHQCVGNMYPCETCKQPYMMPGEDDSQLVIVQRKAYCPDCVPALTCVHCGAVYTNVEQGLFLDGCKQCHPAFACGVCQKIFPNEMAHDPYPDTAIGKVCAACLPRIERCPRCQSLILGKLLHAKDGTLFCKMCRGSCVLCGTVTSRHSLNDTKRCHECETVETQSKAPGALFA